MHGAPWWPHQVVQCSWRRSQGLVILWSSVHPSPSALPSAFYRHAVQNFQASLPALHAGNHESFNGYGRIIPNLYKNESMRQFIALTAAASSLLFASTVRADRFLPSPQRTTFYNTPCTMNGFPSWCAVGQVNGEFASLKVEFAHGDQPILQLVPISASPDRWGAYPMRDAITGQSWWKKNNGYTSLIESGGFANSVCVGPGSRLPYPRGCAAP